MGTVDDFLQRLEDSGLMSADDVRTFLEQSPVAAKKDNVKSVAGEFVRRGKLTKYQATAIWQGQHDSLVMGNYIILDVIGQGGMGTVFKAEHRRLKRTVALKTLSPAAMKLGDAVDRFRREAEAVGKLNHPNIVAAHDAGEFGDKHFLVMEYVSGTDLDRLVTQQGPLPVEVAAACILQAARGLEYAHTRGVVHRDIKPANLLLTTDADRAVVKVLDLGLAWVRDAAPGKASTDASGRLTRNDRIMGTVNYMAPEQALEIHSADQRSDIYSLGCAWYYLVTGRAIYPADTVLKQLVAHRESPIPPLPGANEPLNAVLRKMVAKQPDDRYPSMTAVITAFENCGIADTQASGALDLSGVEAFNETVIQSQPSVSLPRVASGPLPTPRGKSNAEAGSFGHDGAPETATASEPAPPRTKTAKITKPRRKSAKPAKSNGAVLIGSSAAAVIAIIGLTVWLMNRGGETSSGTSAAAVVAPNPDAATSPNNAITTLPVKPAVQPSAAVTPTDVASVGTAPTDEVTGEYTATISGEPWGFQVRRNGAKFAVRLLKGGLPGAGWDRQTTYDLAASPQDGRITLDKNTRLVGTFDKDQLAGTDALGEPFTAQRTVRRSPTLEKAPPTSAIVLFDGRQADHWNSGVVTSDGWLMAGTATKAPFRDFNLHLEYRLPNDSVPVAKARTGLLLQGRYELAIADSFGDDPSETGCAAIKDVWAPSLNLCFPRDQWQTLDVSFSAARFETSGVKTANARCTVRHNGVVVHDNAELRPTPGNEERPEPGPIVLGTRDDSGIVFRNVWLEETRPAASPTDVKRNWPEVNAALQKRIKSAAGMIHDEFALVQTLPLDEFQKFAEGLQEAGYRPVRLRPFVPSNNGPTQTAALWQRDGYEWRLSTGPSADVQKEAEKFLAEGLWPVDIAGYYTKSGETYVTLWAKLPENPAEEARIYPGVRQLSLRTTFRDFPDRGYAERVDHVFIATGARTAIAPIVHSTLWWKSPAKTEGWYGDQTYYEAQNKGFMLDLCLLRTPLNGVPAYSWCSLTDPPTNSESTEVHGLSLDGHLKRCTELADQGYRPVAIGAAPVHTPPVLQGCSVWHRKKE